MNPVAIVILAAGESRRFGGIKQLADIEGKPLLQQVIDQCLQVSETDIYLVLGANSEQIQAGLSLDGVRLINNDDWQQGISSSIRAAVNRLAAEYPAILLIAGDQPRIIAAELVGLIETWRSDPGLICAAYYDETLGIPAIFPGGYYSELLKLQGDRGAKSLLMNQPGLLVHPLESAKFDIDTPDDLLPTR